MKYKKRNEIKTDLTVYFTRFYKYTVKYEDGEQVTYSKTSYFALRQYISNYIGKIVDDVIKDENDVNYVIDYRKTSKEALAHVINLNGTLPIWDGFDPYKHALFPHFKIN